MSDQTEALARDQPHDHTVEQAVLGAILTGHPIEDTPLTGRDFWDPWHETVWNACTHLAATGQTPDVTLVANHLRDGRTLQLFELVEHAGIRHNMPAYTKILSDHTQRRWILNLLTGATQRAHQPDTDPADLADQIRTMLDTQERAHTDATRLADAIPAMIDRIEHGNLRGDSTPWPELDRWVTLQPGRLYTLAARPGVGKSLMGQALATHMSRHHHKASLVASLEMPTDEYVQRYLAAESGVGLSVMDYGHLTEDQWKSMSSATARLDQWNVYVNDHSRQTLASIRADARMVARRDPLGLIVVDYLQLVTPADRRIKREEQVAELTRGFKALAKDLHVPVALIAQLNRESVKDKRTPRLSDLRESGAIEQDSDVVLMLHEEPVEEGEQPSNLVQLLVEKNRGGQNHGRVNLIRKGWIARLEEQQRRMHAA